MPDDTKKTGLILPPIRTGGLIKKPSVSLRPFDLKKQAEVSQILSGEQKSVKVELAQQEQGLDLVLAGDLTGSMTDYHSLLKGKFSSLASELFELIRNLRIGIIFYLDHDNWHPYVTRLFQDGKFGKVENVCEMQDFIATTPTVRGGSTEDEAVECALHDIVNMRWREIGGRSVVLFGDARPHEPHDCPERRDYFELVRRMHENGIVVNCVYCRQFRGDLQKLEDVAVGDFSKRVSNLDHPNFFSWVANVTGGMIIGVDQIDDLIEIIKAAAAKDAGELDKYAKTLGKIPSKLKLLEIAKKADQRLRLANKGSPRLGHKAD